MNETLAFGIRILGILLGFAFLALLWFIGWKGLIGIVIGISVMSIMIWSRSPILMFFAGGHRWYIEELTEDAKKKE
jgi:hypothetical protein